MFWGCGGTPSAPSPVVDTPGAPTPPTGPPPPTVLTVAVTGIPPTVGASSPYTATATLSNSTTDDVTTQAMWLSSNITVATVTSSGLVSAVGTGESEVSATYQSVRGKVRIIIPAAWPPEIAAVLNRGLLVPSGLYLYYTLDTPVTGGGCPGGKTPGFYNPGLRGVGIYTAWRQCYDGGYEDMLFWTGHELGHAHQQRMLLDAGLPDIDLSNWVRTTEGEAFMAAGGRVKVPGYETTSPGVEAFAQICGLWYIRRAILRQYDPDMYAFAQKWLPQ